MPRDRYRRTAGVLAVAFFLVHAAALIRAGEYYHMIWSCHLGCLMVGIGLLVGSRWLHAIGFLWLFMGVPLWLLNILTTHAFMLTSTLSHIGGILLAVYGFKFVSLPRFAWAGAIAGLVILGLVTRLLTPPAANVNLAFAVWTGWEDAFPSYFWYVVMLLSVAAAIFLLLELMLRRLRR